jgi:hypothetical protein
MHALFDEALVHNQAAKMSTQPGSQYGIVTQAPSEKVIHMVSTLLFSFNIEKYYPFYGCYPVATIGSGGKLLP